MADTSLQKLREHLFDTIERLKDGNDLDADPKDTIEIDRAKAITLAAGQIINAAKVEIEAHKIIASGGDSCDGVIKNSNILKIEK